MEGNNVIFVNQATLIRIVQDYFDHKLFAEGQSPRVERIEVKDHEGLLGIHVSGPQDSMRVRGSDDV